MNEETVRAISNAVGEGSKTIGKAIDLTSQLMHYFDGPLHVRGEMVEENMEFRRWENRRKLCAKAAKRLREDGFDGPVRDIPPKFALPFGTYATLEDEDELQDFWAEMLANAANPSSGFDLRTSYIDILKDLTALDIKNLSQLAKLSDSDLPQEHPLLILTEKLPDDAEVNTTLSGEPKRPSDAVLLSLSNLSRAGCISPTFGFGGMPLYTQVCVTTLGMGLYKACTKPRS